MEDTRPATTDAAYDLDFYTWTRRQAELIRSGRWDEADRRNLAEEIESLGRAQLHALRSSYRLVAMHLLKMRFQRERSTSSWVSTVVRERNAIEDCLADNPGLRPKRQDALAAGYAGARREAAAETMLPLKTFPVECPFSLAEIEDQTYWPPAD